MDSNGFYYLVIIALLISEVSGDSANGTLALEKKLQKELLKDYNTNLRPVLNLSKSVDVRFGMSIQGIVGLDEEHETLSLMAWVYMSWTDVSLIWWTHGKHMSDPELGDFEVIQSMRFDKDQIWTPNILLYNTMDSSYNDMVTRPVVYSDGSVSLMTPILLKAGCNVDVHDFPFDSQTCRLKFGSWTYDGNKVNISEANVDTDTYMAHSEFELTGAHAVRNVKTYRCCPEPYIDVTFTLGLKRRTDHATHFLLSPCIICSLLIPFIFLLPQGTNDKVIYGIGQLLANVLVFGEFEAMVPHAYPRVPTKGIVFMVNLVLAGLALVFTVAIIGIWNRSTQMTPVPGLLRAGFLGICGRLCFVHRDEFLVAVETDSYSPLEESNGSTEKDTEKGQRLVAAAEWCQLAAILDRMLFVLFSVLVIITAAVQ